METKTKDKYGIAVLLILLASICISLNSFIGKQLLQSISLPTAMALRYLTPTLILWWFALISDLPNLKRKYIKYHIFRAIFSVLSQYALFYYLQYGSILDATLLYMTSPLFVPLMMRIIRKKPIKKTRWVSIIMGFIGVAFILQPGYLALDWQAAIGLLSGFFNAASQVFYHKIARHSDTRSATLYAYTFSTIIAIIPAFLFLHLEHHLISFFTHPNPPLILLFLTLAIIGISNRAFRAMSFKKVKNPDTLTPFLYCAIIISGLLDWFVYGLKPDVLSVTGTILIISSGLILYFNKPRSSPEAL